MATYRQAVTAQRELHLISGKVKDTITAKRLFDLRRKLDEAVDFVIERQRTNMEQTGVTYNEVGQWIYPDDNTRKEFDRMNTELLDSEMEVIPVNVKAESIPGLSVNDIAALYGFVEITGSDE